MVKGRANSGKGQRGCHGAPEPGSRREGAAAAEPVTPEPGSGKLEPTPARGSVLPITRGSSPPPSPPPPCTEPRHLFLDRRQESPSRVTVLVCPSAQVETPFYGEWWFLLVMALSSLIVLLLVVFALVLHGQNKRYKNCGTGEASAPLSPATVFSHLSRVCGASIPFAGDRRSGFPSGGGWVQRTGVLELGGPDSGPGSARK